MMGVDWRLSDDRKTVTIIFPSDPPVAIELDANGVDGILENLGEFRASMEPPVANAHAMGQKVGAIADPVWVCEPDLMRGDTLLHLRDPRYGWLHFLFPKTEASKLANIMRAQVDQPTSVPDKNKIS